jgi:hypothetical protein
MQRQTAVPDYGKNERNQFIGVATMSIWRKDIRKMERHERAYAYGILIVIFFAFFMTTSLVKAYAKDYSFTPYEYHRLLQDTCLMGERVVDRYGEHFRAFGMRGPTVKDKDGKMIGKVDAFFVINQSGDRAELYIVSEVMGKVTKVFLIDNDLDGKPDLQGESKEKLGEVTRDGKEFWNVWIVRFIERND